jgi:hypothetical protein
MADLTQDSLLSSGDFKATSCSGVLSIASGTSGTLATLSSTGGRKIRLTMLSAPAGGGAEAGISVIADGVTVINGLTLSSTIAGTGAFWVGPSLPSSGVAYQPPLIQHIEAFNTIAITKASGSTASTIYYATEQGF